MSAAKYAKAGSYGRRDDDEFVQRRIGRVIPFGENDGDDDGQHEQHEQRPRARVAVGLLQRARFHRQRRRPRGFHDAHAHRVGRVQCRQRNARNEGARVHVADRLAELVRHDDQHQRRRDDLRQRARGRDDARREATVVAVAQHDRQRDEAHRDDRGRDDARGGRQQRADEDHRVGEAAAHRPEQLADGFEQVLGHAAALEDQPHEREERDREQRVVGHDAPDPFGQRLEQRGLQQSQLDAEKAEANADGAQRERDRIAQQHHDDQRREHQRRHVLDQEGGHASSLPAAARAGCPRPAPLRRSFRAASAPDPE